MGVFVIVAYKPRRGQEQVLRSLIDKHLRVLAEQGLVSDRPAYVMQAAEGTLVEVFEWRSAEAVGAAHGNPAVLALWAEFAEVCDYVPLASLPESHTMFAEFTALA
ncbi:hypothetical protein LRH25_18770 [Ideonella azotifigens]|uniref:ABM domain-containing protein n=1 Tax=Ideonella azotifigens TaxID=513160 RepID=A0ABN1K5E4_9BURK|nr:hypothetical protein [Ideonella azotifigens]MCD2342375.1 hypothetical protein [Ideonella azotifigens]